MLRVNVEVLDGGINFHQMMSIAEVISYCDKTSVLYTAETRRGNFCEEDASEFYSRMNRIILGENPGAAINFLRQAGAIDAFLPELGRCWSVEQNPRYHIDNVFTHCIKVCSLVKQDLILRWAGLLHDVGKYEAKEVTKKAGATFHNHEVYGEKLARQVVPRLGINERMGSQIIFLVRNHMYHYDRRWTDRTVWRFIRKIGINDESIKNIGRIPLFLLRRADRASRGLNPVSAKQMDFEARLSKVYFEHQSNGA